MPNFSNPNWISMMFATRSDSGMGLAVNGDSSCLHTTILSYIARKRPHGDSFHAICPVQMTPKEIPAVIRHTPTNPRVTPIIPIGIHSPATVKYLPPKASTAHAGDPSHAHRSLTAAAMSRSDRCESIQPTCAVGERRSTCHARSAARVAWSPLYKSPNFKDNTKPKSN